MQTLLNSSHQRAIFLGTIAALVLRATMLETKIVIALASAPTHVATRRLLEADERLADAVRALQAAAHQIEGLP